MQLKKDLHIIPVPNGNLVYSPLRRGLFWANDEACKIVAAYIDGDGKVLDQIDKQVVKYIRQLENIVVSPPDKEHNMMRYNSLVVIPSQVCNLACIYCFAAQAHATEFIDKSVLAKAYDQILEGEDVEKHFSFIGGGEPMLTWEVLEWSFEYISAHNYKGHKISYSITTNATIFNEEILSSLRQYDVHVNVSFDILKDIQDVQRPFQNNSRSSFDVIHDNIRLLDESKISYSIRSTITMNNVTLMPDMVQFAVDNYHNLRSLHFEPVTDSNQDDSGYYSDYIDYFFKARNLAKSNGVDLYNSMTRSVFNIKDSFCNGELCITPTGDIVACHRVSSPRDKHFNQFCYGKVTPEDFVIFQDKYQDFLRLSHSKGFKCERCFAYWHCAGICPMERVTLTEEQLLSKCEFIREIIKKALLEYLRK